MIRQSISIVVTVFKIHENIKIVHKYVFLKQEYVLFRVFVTLFRIAASHRIFFSKNLIYPSSLDSLCRFTGMQCPFVYAMLDLISSSDATLSGRYSSRTTTTQCQSGVSVVS